MNTLLKRSLIAVAVISLLVIGLYYKYIYLLHVLTTIATVHDLLSVYEQILKKKKQVLGPFQYAVGVINYNVSFDVTELRYALLIVFSVIAIILNENLFILYHYKSNQLISIIVITQLGDICQYLIGHHFGKLQIGWVSPNKTYEGYFGGLMLTSVSLFYWYKLSYINGIYILSIISGLLSSFVKRLLEIKDYSNLLGPHGGWLDRIDSMFLPIFFFELIT